MSIRLKTIMAILVLSCMTLSAGIQTVHAQADCASVSAEGYTPPEVTVDADRAAALRQLEQDDLALQNLRNDIRTNESNLTRLRSELANAESGTNTTRINELRSQITTEDNQRVQRNSDLQSQERALNTRKNSTQIQQAKIEEEINRLIRSSMAQGVRLTEESQKCGNCENAAILSERIVANQLFTEFLFARLQYELCSLEPDTHPCKQNNATNGQQRRVLDDLRDTMDEWSLCVREKVESINAEERKREQGRVFDVSDVFSLRPDTDRNKSEVPTRKFFDVTNQIATWMITLVSSLAVTTLIIGGFLMIISGGDESRLETGKTIFTYSLIGIIVTLMAYGIIAFLQSIFYQ